MSSEVQNEAAKLLAKENADHAKRDRNANFAAGLGGFLSGLCGMDPVVPKAVGTAASNYASKRDEYRAELEKTIRGERNTLPDDPAK